ncbi:cytochrome P450 736A117-like [Humulus lupulus]|uniref:cytochrome P450 736A117-like n=1 Tax=Humulus lupulus TaxID=3486 RepID=UPI002B415CCF|nr:cytochrome P450 736A117-like [Humulus lupulus]
MHYNMSFLAFINNNSSSFIISLAALLFSVLVYKLWFSITTPKRNLPPSPPALPIVGNLHQLGLYPHRKLQAWSRRYGPVMLLRLGSVPVLVISSATAARQIMKTHDLAFSNRNKSIAFEKLLYNYRDVSSAPYGEYWRQTKSICVLHLLSNKRVQSYGAIREEETKLMVEKIRKSSGAVNLSDLFVRLTNDVVCRVALGRKYDEESDGKKFKELLGEFTELLGSFNIGDYFPKLAWLSHVSGLDGRMEKVAKAFDELLEGVLQDHMNRNNNKVIGNINDQKDFVDILLWIQRENLLGFPIDRTCIKALILDTFAAGTDTTYTVLEWAMTELIRHPNAIKKLQNEVRTTIRNNKKISNTNTRPEAYNNSVTENDLDKMPYLKAVLKETLRLHPPIPLLLPRLTTQDMKISGYDVVSGTQVFINAWAIGRDPTLWEDEPDKFEPERFLFKNATVDYKGHDFGLIPFGAGRRGCPAIVFAMAVNELALANLVHKFDWELLTTGEEDLDYHMTETTGLTSHRKFPLMAVPTEYSDHQ